MHTFTLANSPFLVHFARFLLPTPPIKSIRTLWIATSDHHSIFSLKLYFFITEMQWCFLKIRFLNLVSSVKNIKIMRVRGNPANSPKKISKKKLFTSIAHFIWNIREIKYKTRVAHSVFSKVTLFSESIFLGLNKIYKNCNGIMPTIRISFGRIYKKHNH